MPLWVQMLPLSRVGFVIQGKMIRPLNFRFLIYKMRKVMAVLQLCCKGKRSSILSKETCS